MRPGQRIASRFEVIEHAGTGGMGTVYRALDLSNDQPVALKVLSLGEKVSLERFARVAQLLAGLSHPGIVGYVAHGSWEGEQYLVMEWVNGHTLNRRLEHQGLD